MALRLKQCIALEIIILHCFLIISIDGLPSSFSGKGNFSISNNALLVQSDYLSNKTKQPSEISGTHKQIVFGQYCDDNSDCSGVYWTLWCFNSRCVCYPAHVPDYNGRRCLPRIHDLTTPCQISLQCEPYMCNKNKRCQKKQTGYTLDSSIIFIVGITIALLSMMFIISISVCLRKRTRTSNAQRQSIACIGRTGSVGTRSTLQLLSDLNDIPPSYSDVYMIAPQNTIIKPPSYEDVINQTGWHSEQLFATNAGHQQQLQQEPSENQAVNPGSDPITIPEEQKQELQQTLPSSSVLVSTTDTIESTNRAHSPIANEEQEQKQELTEESKPCARNPNVDSEAVCAATASSSALVEALQAHFEFLLGTPHSSFK